MSYITYGTSGFGAYYTSPVSVVPPSYSGFGAVSPFDPAAVFAQWQTWIPICAPLKGVKTCDNPVKVASVKLVQAALVAAGFAIDPAESSIGRWHTSSRAAWAKFAAANPGVTPSGDSYESFTLSDFQTLAKKAYGWSGGKSGSSEAGMTGGGKGMLLVGIAAAAIAGVAVVVAKRKRASGARVTA